MKSFCYGLEQVKVTVYVPFSAMSKRQGKLKTVSVIGGKIDRVAAYYRDFRAIDYGKITGVFRYKCKDICCPFKIDRRIQG